jgi:hypothetical protein
MEATQTNLLWLSIAYGILFIGIIYGFIRAVYNTITTERKRKKFTPVMVKGDAVYFPVASGNVNGEILEVDGDLVKIIVTVTKSRVYPK